MFWLSGVRFMNESKQDDTWFELLKSPVRWGTLFLALGLSISVAFLIDDLRHPSFAFAIFAQEFVEGQLIIVGILGAVFICSFRPGASRFSLRQALSLLLLFAVIAGLIRLIETHQPLRLTFSLYRADFDAVADAVSRDPQRDSSHANVEVGPYKIVHIFSNDIRVELRTQDNAAPWYRYGFVRLEGRRDKRIDGEELGMDDSILIHLEDGWFVFYSRKGSDYYFWNG